MFLEVIIRIHEDLENFKKESPLVPDHVTLFSRTGSYAA